MTMISASSKPNRQGLAAYSLLELMVVIGLMGVIVASLAGVFGRLSDRQHAKDAAVQFQAMVREASSLARREHSPVRMVFILPKTAAALKSVGAKSEGDKPVLGCRLLIFRVPAKDLPRVALRPMTDSGDEELMPVARMPRFSSLVGDWAASPERPHWVRWDKSVKLEGDLAKTFDSGGFSAVSKNFQMLPARTWATKRSEKQDPYSIYPEHFAKSPYEIMREIKTDVLPEGESLEIGNLGEVTAEDVWAEQKLPHWTWLAGSAEAPGKDRVELPSMDFLPDGSLANREKDELEFRFSNVESETEKWVVKLRTRDAETWIE